MNVILERYPYRYVECGTLENGFPENVISEVIAICSAAQYMNTTVKAHNIPALNDNMNAASVKMMIQKGYQGLAEYMIDRRNK